jgi:hypothetical protein
MKQRKMMEKIVQIFIIKGVWIAINNMEITVYILIKLIVLIPRIRL